MKVSVRDVTWSAQANRILDEVTFEAASGQVVGLLGPNGSGKSSLLRCIAGIRRHQGTVHLDAVEPGRFARRLVARRVALLDQEASTEFDLLLREVVELGRTPYRDRWGSPDRDDEAAVESALASAGVQHLAARTWSTLSGGERQRGQLARALAQQPTCLLLDEPTNHLDIRHQLEMLEVLARLSRQSVTTIAALHDLPLTARYCDSVVVLSQGRVVAAGTPAEALTSSVIARVYGVAATVTPLEVDGSSSAGRVRIEYSGLA